MGQYQVEGLAIVLALLSGERPQVFLQIVMVHTCRIPFPRPPTCNLSLQFCPGRGTWPLTAICSHSAYLANLGAIGIQPAGIRTEPSFIEVVRPSLAGLTVLGQTLQELATFFERFIHLAKKVLRFASKRPEPSTESSFIEVFSPSLTVFAVI